ncbi:hypothetical protein HHI36_015168 [Cryptolaemus montrouzieri]|uniref:Uncharacterized protein n=1 Tax=Cryptolaemus montrouzieri TaxID=559131 RepID=A0ABD2N611_9CUCU
MSFEFDPTIFQPTPGTNCLDNILINFKNLLGYNISVVDSGLSDHKAVDIVVDLNQIFQYKTKLARALKEGLPIENDKLEQYSSVDDDIAKCEELTVENILQNVIVNSEDSDDNDVDDGPEENCPTPSVSEALKATEVLNLFVHSNFDDDTIKSIMSRLPNAVRTSNYRNKNQKQ